MVAGQFRRDRIHGTGKSNRLPGWNPLFSLETQVAGPTNFDPAIRSQSARDLEFVLDMKVPITNLGTLNRDFSVTVPGQGFNLPGSGGPTGTRERPVLEHPLPLQHVWKTKMAKPKPPEERPTITAPVPEEPTIEETLAKARTGCAGHTAGAQGGRSKMVKDARYNPKTWWRDPEFLRDPPNKLDGEPWNFADSDKRQRIKAHDRMMRTVKRPEDAGSPRDDTYWDHTKRAPEYWPGRDTAERVDELPFNDYQVRPVFLPDMFAEPKENMTHEEKVHRMKRIREYFRQRYGGRYGLLKVFRNFALERPGYIVASDLQLVLDQMGVKAARDECSMLIEAADKDYKGALTFDEFADLVYAPDVEVGGVKTQAQERHVRHTARDLLLGLASRFPKLQRFFHDMDPERRYLVNKEQFMNAISSCMNHATSEAVDYLWACNFETPEGHGMEGKGAPHEWDTACVDWRGFMQHVANFAHIHRPPTPVCVRSKKNKKDQVMRTIALTGKPELSNLQWPGPPQGSEDEVVLHADKLVYKEKELRDPVEDCHLRTYHFVEDIRVKAMRGQRALKSKVPRPELERLLGGRERMNRDELVDLICRHCNPEDDGRSDRTASVASWDAAELGPLEPKEVPARPLSKADVQALVATEFTDKDLDVDCAHFLKTVYEWKSKLAEVNDGLEPRLRQLRPKRQRPEHGRYDNYWRARMVMETLYDAMAQMEVSNGGKLKSSKVFKRLDMDQDGYVSLEDLSQAFRKYKVQADQEDIHALMTALDYENKGAVDIGEFTRHYVVYEGNLLDNMSRPIKAVVEDGGTFVGGVENDGRPHPDGFTQRSHSPGATERAGVSVRSSKSKSDRSSRRRSRAGTPLDMVEAEGGGGVGQENQAPERDDKSVLSATTGGLSFRTRSSALDRLYSEPQRITDVIKRRTDRWKPQWTDLYSEEGPPSRYQNTLYPDTRHITEPMDPKSGSYLPPQERFKCMSKTQDMLGVPDNATPQVYDELRKNAQRDFKLERIRKRQADFAERREVAEMAAKEFDERRLARKALTLLEYERRVPISCG